METTQIFDCVTHSSPRIPLLTPTPRRDACSAAAETVCQGRRAAIVVLDRPFGIWRLRSLARMTMRRSVARARSAPIYTTPRRVVHCYGVVHHGRLSCYCWYCVDRGYGVRLGLYEVRRRAEIRGLFRTHPSPPDGVPPHYEPRTS